MSKLRTDSRLCRNYGSWYSGSKTTFPFNENLSSKEHETAGVLYSFELRLGVSSPGRGGMHSFFWTPSRNLCIVCRVPSRNYPARWCSRQVKSRSEKNMCFYISRTSVEYAANSLLLWLHVSSPKRRLNPEMGLYGGIEPDIWHPYRLFNFFWGTLILITLDTKLRTVTASKL